MKYRTQLDGDNCFAGSDKSDKSSQSQVMETDWAKVRVKEMSVAQ